MASEAWPPGSHDDSAADWKVRDSRCVEQCQHCTVLDADGATLLSRRVADDESELLALIAEVGEPGLLIALLVNAGQEMLYISGRAVNRAADIYRGEGKADARDA